MTSKPHPLETARLRRDLRVQFQHLLNVIEADLNCTIAAKTVIHTQGQLLSQMGDSNEQPEGLAANDAR